MERMLPRGTLETRAAEWRHWKEWGRRGEEEGEGLWDDGPPTTYGPKSTQNQEFYSDAGLVVNVANGKRLYQAVEGLMSPPPPPPSTTIY